MKPYGWRMGANDYLYGKVLINGRWGLAETYERVVAKRRGRLAGRRLVEEQMGASRPTRTR
jgi:hypothetical protein